MAQDVIPTIDRGAVASRNPYRHSTGTDLDVLRAGSSALVEIEQQRAMSEVMAAVTLAKRFPRNPMMAVDAIMRECAKPTLASASQYAYARGGAEITGPSIRLAEVLARCWGNMQTGIMEISRSNGESQCMAFAWDLESNTRDLRHFTVKHWRDTKSGGYVIKDERDINELVGNQGARRKRQAILALIPGDVVDAAIDECDATLKASADVTPDAIKKMVGYFAGLGVSQDQLQKRIQRRIDTILPSQIVQLRKIVQSLKDGMSSIEDWFDPTGDDRMDKIRESAANAAPAKQTDTAAGPDRNDGVGNEDAHYDNRKVDQKQNTAPAAAGDDPQRIKRSKAEVDAGLTIEETRFFRASGLSLADYLARKAKPAALTRQEDAPRHVQVEPGDDLPAPQKKLFALDD